MKAFRFYACGVFTGFGEDVSFPDAQQVLLDECGITDSNLAKLVAACPNVSKFSLSLMHDITLENVALVESFGPKLTSLTMYSCHGLGELAVEAVLQRCRALHTLNIINSAFFHDTTVYQVLLDSCPLIRRICLDMNDLSDDTLRTLTAVTQLTHVSIYQAFGFSAVGLAALLTICTGLTELITDSDSITPEAMSYVKELHPDLNLTPQSLFMGYR